MSAIWLAGLAHGATPVDTALERWETTPSSWFAELRASEAELYQLVEDWSAWHAGRDAAAMEVLLDEQARLRARRTAATSRLDATRSERLERLASEPELEQTLEALTARAEELVAEERAAAAAVEPMAAAVDEAAAALASVLAEPGQPRTVRRAAAGWTKAWEQVDWTAADEGRSEAALALGTSTDALLEASDTLDDDEVAARDAISALLSAQSDFDTARMTSRLASQARADFAWARLDELNRDQEILQADLQTLQEDEQRLSGEVSALGEQLAALTPELEDVRGSFPAADRAAGLAGRYAALSLAVDRLDVAVPTDDWCRLWVHGGVARTVAGQAADEALSTAAAARAGACHAVMEPWLTQPDLLHAWARVLHREATRPLAEAVLQPLPESRWRVDGVEVLSVGLATVRLHPGVHRFELAREGGLEVLTVELPADSHSWITLAENRLTAQDLPPGAADLDSRRPTWAVSHDHGPTYAIGTGWTEVGPRHVDVGTVAGARLAHGTTLGTVGVAVHVAPDLRGWASMLSVDGQWVAELASTALYRDRWTSTDRLTRVDLAVRVAPWELRGWTPYAAVGGFVEPTLAAGPRLAAGGALQRGRLALDMEVVATVAVPGARPGVEMVLRPRFLSPLTPPVDLETP